MTFTGGPHGCIGYRFAVAEAKVLIFTLVRAFSFELAIPLEEIGKRTSVVQRPLLKSEPEKGSQLPFFIKRVGDI